jgi:hypothetical protein
VTCFAGARAVQQDILEKHPEANLRVYTVWYSVLAGDSRSAWRSGAMPDKRVTNLWDEQRLISQWVSAHVPGMEGFVWDAYLLYGPEAKWDSASDPPAPLVSSGSTVIAAKQQLEAGLLPLLQGR